MPLGPHGPFDTRAGSGDAGGASHPLWPFPGSFRQAAARPGQGRWEPLVASPRLRTEEKRRSRGACDTQQEAAAQPAPSPGLSPRRRHCDRAPPRAAAGPARGQLPAAAGVSQPAPVTAPRKRPAPRPPQPGPTLTDLPAEAPEHPQLRGAALPGRHRAAAYAAPRGGNSRSGLAPRSTAPTLLRQCRRGRPVPTAHWPAARGRRGRRAAWQTE